MTHPLGAGLECFPSTYPVHGQVLTSVCRAMDRAAVVLAGITPEQLMATAGRAVAAVAAPWAAGARAVLVLCGPGDNGGDGYEAAPHLARAGHTVRVLDLAHGTVAARRSAAATAARARCAAHPGVQVAHGDAELLRRELASATHVVDALFGAGLARDLEGWWLHAVQAIASSPTRVLAVDVPSGVDADTGAVRGAALRAEVTVTLVAPKRALLPTSPAAERCGRIVQASLGLPWALHGPWVAATPTPPGAGSTR